MTLAQITDPASLQRQGLLLAALEELAAQWHGNAGRYLDEGHTVLAERAHQRTMYLRSLADAVRARLVAASDAADRQPPGLADVLARLPDDKLARLAPPTETAAEDEPAESCPLPDCSCWIRTGGPPPAYQVHPTPVCRDVPETVAWLREHQAERWYRYPLAVLEKLARWLLDLRAACWSGRWLP